MNSRVDKLLIVDEQGNGDDKGSERDSSDDEKELRRIHNEVVYKRRRQRGEKVQPWKKGDKPYEYEEEDGDSKSAGG